MLLLYTHVHMFEKNVHDLTSLGKDKRKQTEKTFEKQPRLSNDYV